MGMRVIPYMSHNTQYVHMHDLHGMAELSWYGGVVT